MNTEDSIYVSKTRLVCSYWMYIDLLFCETHKMMIFGKMYFIPNILQNIFLCFTEGKSYSFGMTWGWVNDSRIFIFGWNIHLSCYLLKIQYGQFYDTFMILLCNRATSIIFQTFSFVQSRTESIQVWNNIKVNKGWHNFWLNYSFPNRIDIYLLSC